MTSLGLRIKSAQIRSTKRQTDQEDGKGYGRPSCEKGRGITREKFGKEMTKREGEGGGVMELC